MMDWVAAFAHIGFPAYMKPHSGGGWKSVYKLDTPDDFFRAYAETSQLVMLFQEAVDFSPALRDVFPGAPTMKNGYMHVNEAPGWGVDLNEDLARKFPLPESPGNWLPVRRRDGTPVRP